MNSVELHEVASSLLGVYREALLIDPFIKISIEICDGDFTSNCMRDAIPMAWKLQLNPNRHVDILDAQYSIVEALLVVLFDDLSLVNQDFAVNEVRRRIISRLSTAMCQLLSNLNTSEEADEG